MIAMYYLLTESFKQQEVTLVQIILEAISADSIYLLGSTLLTRRTESVFNTDAPSCRYVGHYYLLVLVSDEEDVNAVQDIIEGRCRNDIPVTAIVLKTSIFNAWYAEGHRFAHTVRTIAVLLHGSKITQPVTTIPPCEDVVQEQNNILFTEGHNKVTEFMAGAELYIIRKQTKLAAFMLHQAAEQALHTLFQLRTGMYVNSHNLDKLVRYCSMFCYNLPEIFPRSSEKEEHIFQLLQKAYVGGRYREEYSITITDLQKIVEKVSALKEVMKNCIKGIRG